MSFYLNAAKCVITDEEMKMGVLMPELNTSDVLCASPRESPKRDRASTFSETATDSKRPRTPPAKAAGSDSPAEESSPCEDTDSPPPPHAASPAPAGKAALKGINHSRTLLAPLAPEDEKSPLCAVGMFDGIARCAVELQDARDSLRVSTVYCTPGSSEILERTLMDAAASLRSRGAFLEVRLSKNLADGVDATAMYASLLDAGWRVSGDGVVYYLRELFEPYLSLNTGDMDTAKINKPWVMRGMRKLHAFFLANTNTEGRKRRHNNPFNSLVNPRGSTVTRHAQAIDDFSTMTARLGELLSADAIGDFPALDLLEVGFPLPMITATGPAQPAEVVSVADVRDIELGELGDMMDLSCIAADLSAEVVIAPAQPIDAADSDDEVEILTEAALQEPAKKPAKKRTRKPRRRAAVVRGPDFTSDKHSYHGALNVQSAPFVEVGAVVEQSMEEVVSELEDPDVFDESVLLTPFGDYVNPIYDMQLSQEFMDTFRVWNQGWPPGEFDSMMPALDTF